MAIDGQCFECGTELRPTVEVPHPDNGMVVPLCERCHNALRASDRARQLKHAHTHEWIPDAFDRRFSGCSVCSQCRRMEEDSDGA